MHHFDNWTQYKAEKWGFLCGNKENVTICSAAVLAKVHCYYNEPLRLVWHSQTRLAKTCFANRCPLFRPTDEFRNIIRQQLPPTWTLLFKSPFLEAQPPRHELPQCGWKLRVTAAQHHDDARQLLRLATKVCVQHKVAFKTFADTTVFDAAHSKNFDALAAGKFITIYVPSDTLICSIADDLKTRIQTLDVLPAAAPLSDAPYPDSTNLSYRYGTYTPGANTVKAADGTPVPDRRDAFYLPPGKNDPVTGTVGQHTEQNENTPVEFGDYVLDDMLALTFAGAVYKGKRHPDGTPIVLKEARPDAYIDGVPAVTRLSNEAHILEQVEHLGISPTVYEIFDVERHRFLAMEDLSVHKTLFQWRKTAKKADDERLHGRIAELLATRIQTLYDADIAWRDISPSNLLVEENAERLYLIDAEFAALRPTDSATLMDIRAFAKILLWLACPTPETETLLTTPCKTASDVFGATLAAVEQSNAYPRAYTAAIATAWETHTGTMEPIVQLLTDGTKNDTNTRTF